MKILLVNPPQTFYDESTKFNLYFPIGLLSIAAKIKDICDVKIFDCLIEDFEITKEKNGSITYGSPFNSVVEAIIKFKPDIVGISIPFTTQSRNAIHIAEICNLLSQNITIVFGGPDASVRYEELLDHCDYCVIGEGEETFYRFIKHYDKPHLIDGIAYKINNKVFYQPRPFIQNLDELPTPAYDLIDVDKYLKSKYLYSKRGCISENSISIITSRGCPQTCIFCSIKLHMGNKFRSHSPEYVVDHIRKLNFEYNITNFHFEDDNISFDKKRFEKILDLIIEEGLNINWDIPNGLRADTLDFELLKKIKKSGCKQLTVAIESGNQTVLDNVIKKNLSLDKAIRTIRQCKMLNINLNVFYIIGFPGELVVDMLETIRLALTLFRHYDAFPLLHFATPLYGTELYRICVEKGYITSKLNLRDLSTATQINGNPIITTEDFDISDINNIVEKYKNNFKKELFLYALRNPLIALEKIIRWLK